MLLVTEVMFCSAFCPWCKNYLNASRHILLSNVQSHWLFWHFIHRQEKVAVASAQATWTSLMQQHEGSDEARCVVACPHKTELALNIFELAIVDKVFVQRFFSHLSESICRKCKTNWKFPEMTVEVQRMNGRWKLQDNRLQAGSIWVYCRCVHPAAHGLEQFCANRFRWDKVPVAPIVALDKFTQAPWNHWKSLV